MTRVIRGSLSGGDVTGPFSNTVIGTGKVVPAMVKASPAKGNVGQVDSSGSAWKWVNGSAYQLPGIVTPLSANPFLLVNSAAAPGSGSARGVRMIAPRDGTIAGVAMVIPASAGNIDVAILDTTATTRNVLYKSGSFACPASGTTWVDLGLNPAVAVTAGQQFDLAVTNNNGGFQVSRVAIDNARSAILPAGWMTDGVTSGTPTQFLSWAASVTVGNWGTTLSEASMTGAGPVAIIVKLT